MPGLPQRPPRTIRARQAEKDTGSLKPAGDGWPHAGAGCVKHLRRRYPGKGQRCIHGSIRATLSLYDPATKQGTETMSSLQYRSSKPDKWTMPRPYQDASLRYRAHGPILPMEPRPGFFARLLHG